MIRPRSILLCIPIFLACLVSIGCGYMSVARKDRARLALELSHQAFRSARDGNFHEALAALTDAIGYDRDCVLAYYLLAWIHATCPDESLRDGEAAIAEANDTLRLYHSQATGRGEIWVGWAALAAAHAEAGDFEKAIDAQRRAVELTQQADDDVMAKMETRARACLKLYESGRPLRTTKVGLSFLSDTWAQRALCGDFPEIAE